MATTGVDVGIATVGVIVVAVVGAFPAGFAATIGVAQNDIKKVLAYSTVSQLGYMFLACGVGAFTEGMFHVTTHAFFKACLFLGAGSVIHAMHARIHDNDKSQDIRHMGGLRKWLPLTHWTFGLASKCESEAFALATASRTFAVGKPMIFIRTDPDCCFIASILP